MRILRDEALLCLSLGYTPLPVAPDSKAPTIAGWQVTRATEDSILRQFSRPSNLGIRTGDVQADGSCLAAIDIDVNNAELVRCVQKAIGKPTPVKQGKKGCTQIFRLSEQIATRKIHWYRDGKKTAVIDVLCRGAQTVIPPSIHPETKLPYRWVAGSPLIEVPYDQLPLVTPTVVDEIVGFCKTPDDAVYRLNDMEWHGVGGGGDTHDTCLAAVASMTARAWPDEDIHARIGRAKREACEAAGMPYDWPQEEAVVQGWIDSARVKFGASAKGRKQISHGALADAFLDQAAEYIRYDRDAANWYFFDKGCWQAKHDFRVRNAVELSLPIELRNSHVISGVESSLRNRPALSIRQQDWDPDPSLLNTPAGVVDLTSGRLRPWLPSDLMTKITKVLPADGWSGSLWLVKLEEWFGNDPVELIYIQTLLGYFLTGETRHACLPLWIGPGGDGKSVIANTLRYIFGDYAKTSTDTAFVDTRHSQHSEELAWLNGARLVLVNEINGSLPWNDSRIKAVTGGEHIAASYKGGHVFEYRPSFKLLITGNEAPRLRSVGPEFKRRFHVYNFTRGVASPDAELSEKLRAEGGAILAWMIEGAIRYYKEGLQRSPLVEAANAEYFEANDLIQQWLNECCQIGEECRVEGSVAYGNFVDWCTDQGFRHPISRMTFTAKLKSKGIENKTAAIKGRDNSVRCYIGIVLKIDSPFGGGPNF